MSKNQVRPTHQRTTSQTNPDPKSDSSPLTKSQNPFPKTGSDPITPVRTTHQRTTSKTDGFDVSPMGTPKINPSFNPSPKMDPREERIARKKALQSFYKLDTVPEAPKIQEKKVINDMDIDTPHFNSDKYVKKLLEKKTLTDLINENVTLNDRK